MLLQKYDSIQDIIMSFNEHERRVYERLKELVEKTALSELKGRYEIAIEIYSVYTDEKSASLYGKKFFERLSLALGFKSQTTVREMCKVVAKFPTWSDVEKIVKEIPEVRWKDLVLLSGAKSEQEFNNLLDDIKEQKSTAELLQKYKTGKENYKGRKPVVPETLDQFLSLTKTLQSINNKIEAFSSFPIYQEVSECEAWPPAKRDEVLDRLLNMLLVVDQTITSLKLLKKEVNSSLDVLEEAAGMKRKGKSKKAKAEEDVDVEFVDEDELDESEGDEDEFDETEQEEEMFEELEDDNS